MDISKLQEAITGPEIEDTAKEGTPVESSAGILGSLACAYASSDEEEEESNSTSNPTLTETLTKVKTEVKTEVNSVSNDASQKRPPNAKRRKRKNPDEKPAIVERLLTDGQVKYQLTKKRRQRDPTLLERLLAPEIRRERNYILQCVRYIVRKNFFDD